MTTQEIYMWQPRKTTPTQNNAPGGAESEPETLEENDNEYNTQDIESRKTIPWGEDRSRERITSSETERPVPIHPRKTQTTKRIYRKAKGALRYNAETETWKRGQFDKQYSPSPREARGEAAHVASRTGVNKKHSAERKLRHRATCKQEQ